VSPAARPKENASLANFQRRGSTYTSTLESGEASASCQTVVESHPADVCDHEAGQRSFDHAMLDIPRLYQSCEHKRRLRNRATALTGPLTPSKVEFPRQLACKSYGLGTRWGCYDFGRPACVFSETQVSFGVHPCRVLQKGHRENVSLSGSLSISARSISTCVGTSFFVLGHLNINCVNGTSSSHWEEGQTFRSGQGPK
jgi:hypothetical protein